MKTRDVSLVTWLIMVAFALTASANVTNITSGGPEYPAFAPAITAAAQGDVLRGRAAVWNEVATVPPNKHVTIDGGYNAAYTTKIGYSVVTNEASSPVFQVMPGAKVYLQSLIIRGGNGSGMMGGGIGALLSTVTVVNSIITNSAAQWGGGIYAAGHVVVSNTHIVNNFAGKQGGGVYVRSGSSLRAYQNTQIRGNVAAQEGGGIYADPGVVEVVSGTLVNNSAATADGGAIFAATAVTLRVIATTVSGNTAALNGGGLAAQYSDVIVRDSTVSGNSSTNDGGGIRALAGALTVSNTVVVGNTAVMGGGGGLHAWYTDVKAIDATFGTLAAPNAAGMIGGGVVAQMSPARLQNVLIEGNLGTFPFLFAGGAYILTDQPLWLSNIVVRRNVAGTMGGWNVNANGGVQAYHLQLISNYATGVGGGALSAQSNLYIDTLRVVGNTSEFTTAGLVVNLYQATGVIHRAGYELNRSNNGFGAGTFGGSGAELLTINDLYVADNTGDANGDGVGSTGGIEISGLKAHVQPVGAPVVIARNKGGSLGGVGISSGEVTFHAPSATLPVWITDNTASLTSGVGGVYLSAGYYGSTARFHGAVYVLSNQGYHGGIVVTNDQFYWQSNQAYLVIAPSNGNVGRVAFNRGEGPGGGLYVHGEGTFARLHGTRLEKNFVGFAPAIGGAAAVTDGGVAHFINTHIVGNFSSNFAGGVAADGSGSIVLFNADFASAPPSHLPPSRVIDNYAHLSGGGVYVANSASLLLFNTIVASNRAANGNGGGVLVQSAPALLANAVITQNRGGGKGYGIGVLTSPSFQLVNSTVAHNHTNGIWIFNSSPSLIQNTIVWGHGGTGYEFEESPVPSVLQHCTVQGGYPGTLILTNDPLFWASGNLDYQLSPGSLNIDTGIVTLVSTDAIGTTRPHLAGYDIGAYEFVPEPAGAFAALMVAWVLRVYGKRATA